MAFDPDAYLAKKVGGPPQGIAMDVGPLRDSYAMPAQFDPDAYLENKRRSFHAGKRDEALAKVAALNAEPDPMSFGEIASESASEIWRRLQGFGRGAMALGSAVRHPMDTFGDPAKRRQVLRGVDDMVTWGYGKNIADKLGRGIDEAIGRDPKNSPTFAETEQADQQAAPDYRTAGNVAGMFMPGATKAVASKAGQLVGKAIPGAGALAGAARGAGGYALTAPAMAAGHADTGDPLEAAIQAGTDLPGALMSVGTGAVGGALANKIRKSRGYEARQLIEKEGKGAKVSVRNPGSGGVFDDELAGVDPTDQGIGVAAKRGARGVLKGIKEKHQAETGQPFKEMKRAVDASPEADVAVDATRIVDFMKKAARDLETDDAVVGKLEKKLAQLNEYATEDGVVLLPERQLNGLRRSLMRMAKVGQTDAPGEKEHPLRAAAFLVKEMVDEGPYADLNKFYAEGASKVTKQRKQLGLKAKPPADEGVDTRKLKLTLEREGQNTKTAGGDSDIAAFRAENPDLAGQTRLAELARARADLSFRFAPRHGGLIDRTVGAALGPAAALGAAATAGGPAGLGVAAGALGASNASPIAGRLLAPMADGSGINPLVWMAMEQKRREAEMAARIRRGGK